MILKPEVKKRILAKHYKDPPKKLKGTWINGLIDDVSRETANLYSTPPDEELRGEVELAVLNFARDYHRYEEFRKDVAFKGIKSHPHFIDQILSLCRGQERHETPRSERRM